MKNLLRSLLGLLFLVVTGFALIYGSDSPWILAVQLGPVIAADTSAQFSLTYVPQFLTFNRAATPTLLRITVQGDGVILDLDATGIDALGNNRVIDNISNQYVFQLANGLIQGKNVTVEVTNPVGATLTLRGYSRQVGQFYFQRLSQIALANSGIDFTDFSYLAFPNAAAADIFNITTGDRGVQGGPNVIGVTEASSNREDIQSLLQLTQVVTSPAGSAQYNIDNYEAMIQKVNFIPQAQQKVYYTRMQRASGVVEAAIVGS